MLTRLPRAAGYDFPRRHRETLVRLAAVMHFSGVQLAEGVAPIMLAALEHYLSPGQPGEHFSEREHLTDIVRRATSGLRQEQAAEAGAAARRRAQPAQPAAGAQAAAAGAQATGMDVVGAHGLPALHLALLVTGPFLCMVLRDWATPLSSLLRIDDGETKQKPNNRFLIADHKFQK